MPSFQNERIFIIDTNTYLRIADSFHPLIEIQFGTPVCKLRVVPMLDHELKRNPRLISKFHWACSEDYIKDRRHYIKISNALKLQIEQTEGYLHAAAQQLELNTSVIDVVADDKLPEIADEKLPVLVLKKRGSTLGRMVVTKHARHPRRTPWTRSIVCWKHDYCKPKG